jgi:hypothetical protein
VGPSPGRRAIQVSLPVEGNLGIRDRPVGAVGPAHRTEGMEHRLLAVWSELEYDTASIDALAFGDAAKGGRPIQISFRIEGQPRIGLAPVGAVGQGAEGV